MRIVLATFLAAAWLALALPVPAYAARGDCGQPVSDGSRPTAGDALVALRTAVGLDVCKPCVCDANANGGTTAVDALLILHVAVDLGTELSCAGKCDALCRDGLLDTGEECDDRNAVDGDGCDSNCTVTRCGNGIATTGEECDDGGDSPVCDLDCTLAVCTDGRLNPFTTEQCDDGNALNRDACDNECTRKPACGNGIREDGEECDDGNHLNDDGCGSACVREACGDVNGEVRCIACVAPRVPKETFGACTCPPGFETVNQKCVDIDECATGLSACSDPARCVNVPGSYSCSIDCTPDAFLEAVEACGAPTGVITFACNDTTIVVPAGAARRTSRCDDLVIDGLDRNVAFELDPPCFAAPVSPDACAGELAEDGTCECPLIENGEAFLVLRGARNTVRNLTVRYFPIGVQAAGRDNTVEDSTFTRMCRDAIDNIDLGVGNVFRRLTVTDGCNTCSENSGDITRTDTDPRLRGHYNAIFEDVSFSACRQPLRMTTGGRFLVDHVTMTHGPADSFGCNGPRFTSTADQDLVVELRDTTVQGCRRGVRIGGDAQALLHRNTITDARYRGVLATKNALARLSENVILRNGGSGSAEPGFGGVAVSDEARMDLGGGLLTIDGTEGTSPGGNVLCDNFTPGGDRADVQNESTSPIQAIGNYWCTLSPETRVTGEVEIVPFADVLH